MNVERALGFILMASFAGCAAGIDTGECIKGLVAGWALATITVAALMSLPRKKD